MNTSEKNEISRLRHSGCSFTTIATSTGIPIGTITSYCNRNGIKPFTDGYCKQCGKELIFIDHYKKKEFCSKSCHDKWWNENRHYSFTCKHCKKVFEKTRNDKPLYCSHACYIAERFGGN